MQDIIEDLEYVKRAISQSSTSNHIEDRISALENEVARLATLLQTYIQRKSPTIRYEDIEK